METSPKPTIGFKTILVDSANYHVKHPLTSHWTLHQKMGSVSIRGGNQSSSSSSSSSSTPTASSRLVSKKDWDKTMQESVTIGTIEDFWCIFNKMQDISTLPDNCDYFFMRQGVSPAWEDKANIGGGEYRITPMRGNITLLPLLWRQILMMAVGSQLSEHASVNGVQFAYRSSKSRISVWLKEIKEEEVHTITKKEIQDIISQSLESIPSSSTPPSTIDSSSIASMFRIEYLSFNNESYRGNSSSSSSSSSNSHGGNHPLKPSSYKPSITTRSAPRK